MEIIYRSIFAIMFLITHYIVNQFFLRNFTSIDKLIVNFPIEVKLILIRTCPIIAYMHCNFTGRLVFDVHLGFEPNF